MSVTKVSALKYAAAGIPVIPLHNPVPAEEGAGSYVCSCGNRNCSSVGKHPRTRSGAKDATKDMDQIAEWWERWPDANIGMPTGLPSGFIVVDADNPDAIKAVEGAGFPATVTADSARGRHYYYWRPATARIPNSAGRVAEHVDVRGDGGYVVLPPSLHQQGRRYAWRGAGLDSGAVPAELVDDALIDKMVTPRDKASGEQFLEEIPAGQRNNTLASLAGSMRRAGFQDSAIEAALLDTNRKRCKPPLPDAEVRSIAKSISRYEPGVLPGVEVSGVGEIRLLDRDALDDMPAPRWLIERHLVENSLSVLYGPSNIGKSFAALDMALSVATGLPWHRYGREGGFVISPHIEDPNARGGIVVYLAAEGAFGIAPRVRAWEHYHSRRATNLYVVPDAVQLMDSGQVVAFIEKVAEGTFAMPKMVVIDTLARCAAGADENSAQDMGKIISHADEIRTRFESNVMLIHHTGKNADQERGSSALRGAADTMIKMWQPDDSPSQMLICDKQKDFTTFDLLHVRLKDVVYGEDPDDNTSAVLVPAEETDQTCPDAGEPAGFADIY